MTYSRIDVSMYIPAKPPRARIEQLVSVAQQLPCNSMFIWDHVLDFFPQAIWDEEFSWLAKHSA